MVSSAAACHNFSSTFCVVCTRRAFVVQLGCRVEVSRELERNGWIHSYVHYSKAITPAKFRFGLTSGYTLAGGCMLPCFMLWRSAACTCRYLSVAKNKRLRVFIVPREHLDEVGGHPSAEKMVGCNALVYWLPIVPQQTHKWSIHMVVLCSSVYMARHCGGRMRCHLLWG